MPFAIATNFRINGRDYLAPMVVEEASVVAACSSAAKLFRLGGGFTASADEPIMIGQVQVLDLPDIDRQPRRYWRERQRFSRAQIKPVAA